MPKRRNGGSSFARKLLVAGCIFAFAGMAAGSGYLYYRRPADDRDFRDLFREEKGLYRKAVRQLPEDLKPIRRDGSLPDAVGIEIARVDRVLDGNTVEVDIDGEKHRIDLLKIETRTGDSSVGRSSSTTTRAAAEYMKSRLEGSQVRLVAEPGDATPTEQGHRSAYLFLDGENFNVEMVRRGFSPYFAEEGTSHEYDADFRSAEREARDSSRGIWGDAQIARAWMQRKSRWGNDAGEGSAK